MNRTRRLVVLLAVACLTALTTLTVPGGTGAQAATTSRHRTWAPEKSATITPGVQMYTKGSQCTANFVFTDNRGNVFVGYAAHCAGTGEATDTDGCSTGSVARGTRVTFARGGSPATSGTVVGHGTLVYSSWITMRKRGVTNAATCAYNDFALVKVDRADVRKVNPTVPFFGGPTGLDTNGLATGERVYSYGNSSLRGGITALSPKRGIVTGANTAWSHNVYTASPGIPGDSGSGFLSAGGKAVGVLSTLALAPLPLSNGVGTLAKELAFAQQHSGIPGLRLTLGTRGFSATG